MAFGGYEVNRSNIYNHETHDNSSICWNENDMTNAVIAFAKNSKVGDVITVFERETEDNPYIVCSLFNHPEYYALLLDDIGDIDIQNIVLDALYENHVRVGGLLKCNPNK